VTPEFLFSSCWRTDWCKGVSILLKLYSTHCFTRTTSVSSSNHSTHCVFHCGIHMLLSSVIISATQVQVFLHFHYEDLLQIPTAAALHVRFNDLESMCIITDLFVGIYCSCLCFDREDIYLLIFEAWSFCIMCCLDSCSEQWNLLDTFGIPFI
jgi:hypothetical protein